MMITKKENNLSSSLHTHEIFLTLYHMQKVKSIFIIYSAHYAWGITDAVLNKDHKDQVLS